jgi:transposase
MTEGNTEGIPAYTSKTCSNCCAIFEGLTLSDRWVVCDCGLSLDRDHNAAINILKRTQWDTPVLHNVGARETGFSEAERAGCLQPRAAEATQL